MDEELNKENLILKISMSHKQLMDFLETLGKPDLVKTNQYGWNVKDFVIHLAKWQDGITYLLQKKDRWTGMGISEDVFDADNDTINEEIKQNNSNISFGKAVEKLHSSHIALLQVLDNLTLEDLLLPYSHYDQESDNQRPVLGYVVGNTFGHFEPHLNQMKIIINLEH